MSTCALLFLVSLQLLGLQASEKPAPDCDEPRVTGKCMAYFKRYHYDKSTGQCNEFIYGGCEGNGNNYKTYKDCMAHCQPKAAPKNCILLPETGRCKAAMTRYWYNAFGRECQSFTYGGCGGNGNNYQTIEDCEASCMN